MDRAIARDVFTQARAKKSQSGFTLVEVMVAATVLLVGVLGTFSMIDTAQRTTQGNTAKAAAVNLAREVLEHARSLDYQQVAPSTLVSQLRTKPGLTGRMVGGAWIITRRGLDMEVSTSVCTADDPMDGLAAVAPQNACPAAAAVAGTPVETNPDDFRRVAIALTWTFRHRTQRLTQTEIIANPGGGLGPRVTAFPDPRTIQVTGGVTVPFWLPRPPAATVRWSMDDGITAGDALGGPTGWNFNWAIGTVGIGSWKVDG